MNIRYKIGDVPSISIKLNKEEGDFIKSFLEKKGFTLSESDRIMPRMTGKYYRKGETCEIRAHRLNDINLPLVREDDINIAFLRIESILKGEEVVFEIDDFLTKSKFKFICENIADGVKKFISFYNDYRCEIGMKFFVNEIEEIKSESGVNLSVDEILNKLESGEEVTL